jgi:hypothetical protein
MFRICPVHDTIQVDMICPNFIEFIFISVTGWHKAELPTLVANSGEIHRGGSVCPCHPQVGYPDLELCPDESPLWKYKSGFEVWDGRYVLKQVILARNINPSGDPFLKTRFDNPARLQD